MLTQFGEYLKSLRLEKNLTTEQLAEKIRCELAFIEQFEAGNFFFREEVIIKAYLRSVARALRINEKLITRQFEEAKAGNDFMHISLEEKTESAQQHYEPVYAEEERTAAKQEPTASSPKLDIATFAIIAVLVVALLGTGVYYLFFAGSTSTIQVESSTAETERYIEEEPEEHNNGLPVVPQDSILLGMTATDSLTIWIGLMADSVRYEVTLRPGDTKHFTAKSRFRVIMGKTVGLALTFNNQPLTLPRKQTAFGILINSKGEYEEVFLKPRNPDTSDGSTN